ncbi:hypothetical protein TIFTF001_044921 [Ficus carica]|uniref:Uncharacterized protein n=1 Tax=Ficus carica TaxID=3494 RepID=A0AA88CYF5_FICCA|nr:hypothetical protein TIFTF001_044921 [Ficus carica]
MSCKLVAPYHFPNWLKNQRMLSHLDISDLGISDSIPSWFQNLTSNNMYYLNLSNNQIHAMSPISLSMGVLSVLDLSSNNLLGILPRIQAESMAFLSLSNNQFSGSITPLCNFSLSSFVIVHLDLSNNQFVMTRLAQAVT